MDRLRKVAHHIGYEWAMLLGAAETNWHHDDNIAALKITKRSPLRVIHLHARKELVWLHARVLYGFLFKNPKDDDLSVQEFLEGTALKSWGRESGNRPGDLCPTVSSQCVYTGRANKKLFHATDRRITDPETLPGYDVARDELRLAFAKCYNLMTGDRRTAFRNGLDDEWDVTTFVLGDT